MVMTMDQQSIGKLLLIGGLLMAAVGLLILAADKFLPLGRLPGDFRFESGRFTFYFPLATSIILSIILTLLLQLWNRR